MKKQNILIIGAGGREHALLWKLSQSPMAGKFFCAPGNGGTAELAKNIDLSPKDIPSLLNFAKDNDIHLTVVGSEESLALGIVDIFQEAGLRIFGPTGKAAQLEASKAFAHQIMAKNNIPAASSETFDNYEEALRYVELKKGPLVVKASGLAEGKGVIICRDAAESKKALEAIMIDKKFKHSGDVVVIEEFLEGVEFSAHAVCDGKNAVLFPFLMDHKRVNDKDEGLNTGGMGTVGPIVLNNVFNDPGETILDKVVNPVLTEMAAQGKPFSGCLFPGIIANGNGPHVLEFNVRFGDPETESFMRLLNSDLLEILNASIDGELNKTKVEWKSGFTAYIVAASHGYPGEYKKGLEISGIDEAKRTNPAVEIFHAGTAMKDGKLLTNGGRVLGVSAFADSLEEALRIAYEAIGKIKFDGIHYRTDIGQKALRLMIGPKNI